MRSKFIILITLVVACASSARAQSFELINEKVSQYRNVNNLDQLANQINEDFNTDLEKAKAIYAWISMNVSYDVAAYLKGTGGYSFSYRTEAERVRKIKERNQQTALKTLQTKKGVCDGYANLYKAVAEKADLECVLINGYSKNHQSQIGRTPTKTDHAWNAVKIDNDWLLLDATWGAGFVNGRSFTKRYTTGYFNTSPQKFHLNHFPEDPKWAFDGGSLRSFVASPVVYASLMELDLTIVNPTNGTLKYKKGKEITFTVEADTIPTNIWYAYSNQKYSEELVFEALDGKRYRGTVPAPEKKADELHLFYRNSGIATYLLN